MWENWPVIDTCTFYLCRRVWCVIGIQVLRILSCKMYALDYETKTLTFSMTIFTLLPMLYCRKEKRLMSGYWSNFVCFNSIFVIIANSYPLDTSIQHINIFKKQHGVWICILSNAAFIFERERTKRWWMFYISQISVLYHNHNYINTHIY